MEPQSWIQALLKRAPLAIMVLGVLVFVVGAAGGFDKLKISETPWRVAVAASGVCIFGLGIFLLLREDPWARNYGLRITSPLDGDDVSEKFNVSGIYKTKPPSDVEVKLFVCSPTSGHYWPNQTVRFDERKKIWQVLSVGTGAKPGEKKKVGIALLGKDGQALCEYYGEVSKRMKELRAELNRADIYPPGIPNKTDDFTIVHEIDVKRA